MRKREEVIKDWEKLNPPGWGSSREAYDKLILEVLLDIREQLKKKR